MPLGGRDIWNLMRRFSDSSKIYFGECSTPGKNPSGHAYYRLRRKSQSFFMSEYDLWWADRNWSTTTGSCPVRMAKAFSWHNVDIWQHKHTFPGICPGLFVSLTIFNHLGLLTHLCYRILEFSELGDWREGVGLSTKDFKARSGSSFTCMSTMYPSQAEH